MVHHIKFFKLRSIYPLSIIFLLLILNTSKLQANEDIAPFYQWGHGYHIPAANLTLGGYFKASYNYLEETEHELALDDLSLFISWRPFSRLHIFSELELEDLFSLDGVPSFHQSFRVERLYADVLVSDAFTLRLGQYLTPFSRWNVLHASPLVWTSSRPMMTEDYVMPEHGTGLEIIYNGSLLDRDLGISLFADDTNDLDITPFENPFIYAFGSHINYQVHDTLNIGSSYVYAKTERNNQSDWEHTLGVDFLWQYKRYEAQFESFFSLRNNSQDNYGLYLQVVAPIPYLDTVFAVGRYEYMYGSVAPTIAYAPEDHIQLGIIGLTWRPAPPLALKIEYRFGQHNQGIAESGFLSSIAMFF